MTILSTCVSRLPLFGRRLSLPSAETVSQYIGRNPTIDRPVRQPEQKQKTTFKIASRHEELKAALELVYRAYVRSGLTHLSRHAIRVTPYHVLPSTEVLVAKDRGKVICTMSLVRDTGLGLPMEDIYEREIAQRRRRGIRLAEVSCLADDRKGEACSFSVVSRLMALTAQCAVRRGVDQLVIVVHPRHAAFYQRFIAFTPIGEEKAYAAVCDNPAIALVLDLKRLSFNHPKAHRRLFAKPFPAEVLRYKPISLELQHELRYLAEETREAEGYDKSESVSDCA